MDFKEIDFKEMVIKEKNYNRFWGEWILWKIDFYGNGF